MSAKQNSRDRSKQSPSPNSKQKPTISDKNIEQIRETRNEENSGGVAAGERKVINRNSGDHVRIVVGARSAED